MKNESKIQRWSSIAGAASLLSILGASVCVLVGWASPCKAAMPAVVITSAPLVSPATALNYYGNPASPTPPAARDPLVQEIARSLRYDIDRIFEHVRDNVEFVPIWGVQKGARGVVLDGYGTAFDQAQFMVEALREADAMAGRAYNPAYVLGQISLSRADFASWTGVDDAAAATKLLANGGIPATVALIGGGPDFTVTMQHIWVRASVGGTNYLFDPSYKPHVAHAGLDWLTASQYSTTNLLASGGGGTDPAVVSGFNTTAFNQQLKTYRTNVETFLRTNATGERADAVVGYSEIVPHPASENRRTSLPYAVAGHTQDRLWTGQIPDVYRASLTVSLNGTAFGTYFADQIGEQVREFGYYFDGTTFKPNTAAVIPILVGSYAAPCDAYLGNEPAAPPPVVTVQVNHPYAANSGQYADRTLSKTLVTRRCGSGHFYLTNDWGYTGDGMTRRMTGPANRLRLSAAATVIKPMEIGTTLANLPSKYSKLLDLAARAEQNAYQLHDLIGIHTVDYISLALQTDIAIEYTTASMLTMDFEAAVSAFSLDGTHDAGAAFAAGIGLSFVEGSVPRQETDAVYDMAAINLLTQQQARATTSGGSYSTFLATPATWASVKNNLAGDYPTGAISAMQSYIDEGYSLFVPEHGSLRQPRITVSNPNVTRTASMTEGFPLTGAGQGPEVTRSVFLAWRNAGSMPDRVALVVYDPRHGRVLKGGIGVAQDPVANSIRMPDLPKIGDAKAIRTNLGIDGKTGTVTYSPAPDIVDGSGPFPYSLSFQRAYDQRDLTNYGVGVGWKTNWSQLATLSNDGDAALGGAGAQAIASALVG